MIKLEIFWQKKAHPGKGALWEVPLRLLTDSGFFASETLVRFFLQKLWNDFSLIPIRLETRLYLYPGIGAVAVQTDVDIGSARWVVDGEGFVVVVAN